MIAYTSQKDFPGLEVGDVNTPVYIDKCVWGQGSQAGERNNKEEEAGDDVKWDEGGKCSFEES
jgi:hypothetical protein